MARAAIAIGIAAWTMVVGMVAWLSGMPKKAMPTQQIKQNALIISDASEHNGVSDRPKPSAAPPPNGTFRLFVRHHADWAQQRRIPHVTAHRKARSLRRPRWRT